ncbi:MAG: purine-nucleoside phosphorylase [Desulfovibrio sp.]|jgi:purine-nucleoside phosphorylase|nr:purine-nucleoside phosphorylase [Desulfovibrio sp.]
MQKSKKVQICVAMLKSSLPQEFSPKIGIVLGTGLGNLACSLQDARHIPYADLPGFPQSTAPSHHGAFSAGTLAGISVILQQGRCHLYEGRTPDDICMGVRVMAELGITSLILTNAAGAINPLFSAGSLMLITDQINLTGQSPLTGPDEDSRRSRFPDMSGLYDPDLIRIMEQSALSLGIGLKKGVYLCIPGPQLETRAETRAYRLLGGDAVGMSTALEAIAAKHRGLRVLGVSCLSNQNLPDCMAETTIEDIIATAEKAAAWLESLLLAALPALEKECR